jgi:hypothetical protein
MKKSKVIVILCFVSGNVYVLPYNLSHRADSEDFFETSAALDLGLRASDCQWMVTTEDKINN